MTLPRMLPAALTRPPTPSDICLLPLPPLHVAAAEAAGGAPDHTTAPHVMLGVAEAVEFGFDFMSLGFGEVTVTTQIGTQLNLGNCPRTVP